MFSLRRVGTPMVTERDAPCDDSGLLMRSALHGDVMYVDMAVTTKTDGNSGESVREGLVIETSGVIGHSLTLQGMVGYRRVYERFLLTDGMGVFSHTEQRHLLKRIELMIAGLIGDQAGMLWRRNGRLQAISWLRESLLWVHSPRSWLRMLRRTTQEVRRIPA